MKSRLWLWFPVLAVSAILLAMEWGILPQLNQVFFGDYHDALKNYYTVLYHVKWDETYFHFDGMNFPYGEHVLFTDNQPALSALLKFVNHNIFQISPYIPGIINGLILVSFPLCAWFLNLALRQLGSLPWIAALASTGIVFMTPQINRIQRHFALSYSFIIPMLLYLGLLHLKNPKWQRSWLIAIIVATVAFIHAYYLGFALLIMGCLLIIGILRDRKETIKHLLHFLIQALIPFLLVQMTMFLTDSVTDRPDYPWSPFLGDFILRGFVINYDNPVSVWLSNSLQLPFVDWEAKAYLGIYTILFLIISLVVGILALYKPLRRRLNFEFLHSSTQFLLLTALMAVVVSFTYSYLSGDTSLFQYMGPMRQFRAVGRFYWVSFFALSLVSYSWLSYWLKKRKSPAKWMVLLLVMFLLFYDAFHATKKGFHRIHPEPMFIAGSEEQVAMQELLAERDLIIPLPYFHIGSEDYAVVTHYPRHYKNAQVVSYAAGIPMTANALSRTSLTQTLELLTYRYWPVQEAPFLEQIEGRSPVLLIDRAADLSIHEQLILKGGGADTLYVHNEFLLLGFDQDAYRKAYSQTDSISNYFRNGPTDIYVRRDFEDDAFPGVSGKGSRMIAPNEVRPVDSLVLPSKEVRKIKVGLWVHLNQSTKASEGIVLDYYKSAEKIWSTEPKLFRKYLSALHGDWGYIETELKIPEGCTSVVIRLSRNRLHPTPTYIDDLRVSLKGIHESDERLSHNRTEG